MTRDHIFQAINFIFKRSAVLYLLVFLVAWRVVKWDIVQMNFLDYERDSSGYLPRIARGEIPVDPQRVEDRRLYYLRLKNFLPVKALAYGNLGFCYFHLGQYAQAIHAYQKAIALDKSLYALHYNLGHIFLLNNQPEDAEQSLRAALDLVLPNIVMYKGLEGKFKDFHGGDAVVGLGEMIAMARGDQLRICEELAGLYFKLKNYSAVLSMVERGLAADKNHTPFYYYAGLVHYTLKKYPAAVSFFTQALERDPRLLEGYYYRGLSRQKLGDKNLADMDFIKVSVLKSQGVQETVGQKPKRLFYFDDNQLFFKIYSLGLLKGAGPRGGDEKIFIGDLRPQ